MCVRAVIQQATGVSRLVCAIRDLAVPPPAPALIIAVYEARPPCMSPTLPVRSTTIWGLGRPPPTACTKPFNPTPPPRRQHCANPTPPHPTPCTNTVPVGELLAHAVPTGGRCAVCRCVDVTFRKGAKDPPPKSFNDVSVSSNT